MLFRYLRSNFLFWFGCIFTAVGLILFVIAIFVPWRVDQGVPTYWVTVALVFLASSFFIPGVILAGKRVRDFLRSVTALQRGQYIVGRVEDIVSANEYVNGRPLHRVAWSWQGHDGKRRKAKSPSLSKSDASHWKRGDEIAAYVHPSDLEFAEADVYGFRAT